MRMCVTCSKGKIREAIERIAAAFEEYEAGNRK